MRLRKADCGHWIHEDEKPAGVTRVGEQELPVHLCSSCRSRISIIEKAVEPVEKRKPGRPRKVQ